MSVCLYSCRPKRRMGAAIAVSGFFFCASAVFAAAGLNNPLRWLFILTALVLLAVFLMTVKRFIATDYSYAVYSGETADLVICEHTVADREPIVVGRVALSEIKDIRTVKRKKEREEKPRQGDGRAPFYNYSVSMFEWEYTVITFADGSRVKLTHDEGLLEILNNNRK